MYRFFFILMIFLCTSGLAFAEVSPQTSTSSGEDLERMEDLILNEMQSFEQQTTSEAIPGVESKNTAQAPQISKVVTSPVNSQSKQILKIVFPIFVEEQGTDSLGLKFAFHLKEIFNTSSLFRLNNKQGCRVVLQVKSIDEFAARPGLSSFYSVTWLFVESDDTVPYFLQTELGLISEKTVHKSAEKIVIQTSKIMEKFSYLFQ